jgi:hypothetical protein
MNNFNTIVTELLTELTNVAGGVGSVTGPVTSGNYGNQFPSQNDSAYAPGDARIPSILGAKKRKKKSKVPVQRRNFPSM